MIERIFTRPVSGGSMVAHQSVRVTAGAGIEGDRYFGCHDEPGQNITLVEAEVIEGFLAANQRGHDLSVTGRNLVTRGVRLNELVGKAFSIGQVRLKGVELCDPCLTLGEALAGPTLPPAAVVKQFVQRGGLRADVLSSGDIHVGATLLSASTDLSSHPTASVDPPVDPGGASRWALDLPRARGGTRLRSLGASDFPVFAAYRADADLAAFQGWEPMGPDQARAFLQETAGATHLAPGQWIQLAIADAGSDHLLGDVGLYLAPDGAWAEIGFTLAPAHQGRGHALRAAELAVEQAFRVTTVSDIRAVTDELNHRSVAVLRRAGFLQTGARHAVFKGKACVELLFARGRGGS